ncbi:peptidoglycan DD-metalloendopeptidase family protein [Peribacillus asahii]|uniref:peptidoglycan DD-metalloendopeptidase family protein n=1 Tax=Peribacillus asahii TaxID=228899 RepID=UPI0037FF63AC
MQKDSLSSCVFIIGLQVYSGQVHHKFVKEAWDLQGGDGGMDNRRKNIRDRIEKRRKISERKTEGAWRHVDNPDEDLYTYTAYESSPDHPLFKKEYFLFKMLAAVCLFLIIAVIFKHPSQQLDTARDYVSKTMEQDFQFASISSWYESTFGKPIAFLPQEKEKENETETVNESYALPATAKITQTFETNGEGIIVETTKGSMVSAINEGFVTFAGVKEGIGKTIIVQHENKSESWYGQLESFDVGLYEPIKKGQQIGQVTGSEDGSKGTFYLAIKENGAFIDPKQVISFE